MRWTRRAPNDERRVFTDGEVVWSWRAHAGAKFRAQWCETTVAIKLVHRGEREVSRKPLRREGRRDAALTCGLRAFSRKFLARRPTGACGHPVFPAPSIVEEGQANAKPGRKALRERGSAPSSSSSLRTQGPIATGLRRFDEWSPQPAQITSAGGYGSLRSQGRRRGLRMMAVPPNHIMLSNRTSAHLVPRAG